MSDARSMLQAVPTPVLGIDYFITAGDVEKVYIRRVSLQVMVAVCRLPTPILRKTLRTTRRTSTYNKHGAEIINCVSDGEV